MSMFAKQLLIAGFAYALCYGCGSSPAPGTYQDQWGTDSLSFASGGKADGLLDNAPVLALGETATGFVDQKQLDIYAIDLGKNDKIQVVMTGTGGDLNPHVILYAGAMVYVGSESYQIEGKELTKVYIATEKARYYLVTRAYQGKGSGTYSVVVRCLEGPCQSEPIDEKLNMAQTNDCIKNARECAFSRMAVEGKTQDDTRNLWNSCLAETRVMDDDVGADIPCKNACSEHSEATALCENIINNIPLFAAASADCMGELNDCQDVCYDEWTQGDYDFETSDNWKWEFGYVPENMCLVDGYNGNCFNYAKNHETCGGNAYADGTYDECMAYCASTIGVWYDDLDTICVDRCGDLSK